MEVKEVKAAIRKEITAMKKNFSLQWRIQTSQSIIEKIETLESFINSRTVLVYHALPDEVQTEVFLKRWHSKKQIVLPVVNGDDLILRVYSPGDVKIGYCSILEPTDTPQVAPCDIDLAIIPGVAFDCACNRLGRGRGFYDRLLPELKCDLVGLGFDFQVVDSVPMEPFDKKLSALITETKIITL